MRSRVALLLLLPVLVGCGQETSGSPAARDPQGIGGTYTADGLPDWARGVDRLGIELRRDELRFSAGCNQFSGPVAWEVGGTFDAGPLGGTEMGCEQRAMDVDARLADFFGRADHLELDGTDIRISAGDEGIWFVPTSEQPDEQPAAVELEGTTWRLTGIGEYDGDLGSMSSAPEGVSSSLRIEGSDLTFETGCNSGFGHVQVEGDELALRGIGATLVGCNGARGEVERGVLSVLSDGRVSWDVHGTHLTLLTEDHRHQLDYDAQ